MYNVSNTFRQKMKMPAQKRRLYGTIGQTSFTQANVIQGSFTIVNQCSGDQSILIGQVYVGELKATFKGLDIERSTYKGLEIVAYNGLEIAAGQYEDVPLGHYFIDNAKWTSAGVTVVAYDAMAKFDKTFPEDILQGKIYNMILFACTQCGVTLGMTEEQIAEFPNGTDERTLYPDNDIETYRDLISWCAQTLGANATINRNGELVFRLFSQTAVDTLTAKDRSTSCQVFDYESFYTGISVVNMAEQTTSYYGLEVDNGLTMNLGSNPLVQYGEEQQLETQRRAILNAVAVARYTPAKIRVLTPLVYDLMDAIQLSGGLAGSDTVLICVTKFSWTFGGMYLIECTGTDPTTADARSKVDKHLQGLLASTKQDTIEYYLFTNSEQITIADGETKKIIDIRFASNKSTVAIFQAEILVGVSTTVSDPPTEGELAGYYDAVCTIKYRYNGIYIDSYQPQETWVDGNHILHLLYYIEMQTALESRLEVLFQMVGGSLTIPMAGVKSSIYGQALAATDRWDGTIDIKQIVGNISLGHPNAIVTRSLVDTVVVGVQVPRAGIITQEIPLITLSGQPRGISVRGLTDTLTIATSEQEV